MAKKKPTHKEKSTDQQQQQSNHQSQGSKMDPDQPTAIEDPAEKLSSLKSLNALLLKETVEKRQEVGALLESKKSLESELTRSVSEIEALRAELGRMEDGGMEVEVRKGVVSAFVESQMSTEVESLKRQNEDLKREKEGVEKRLGDMEREMGEVVKERNELEKAKIEGDMEIRSMKKLEIELRSEIKREREAVNQAVRDNDNLKQDLESQIEEGNRMREKIAELEVKEKSGAEEIGELKSKYQVAVNALDDSRNRVEEMKIELGSLERNCEQLKNEIEGLKEEKELILREKAELQKEKSEQEVKICALEKEVSGLNAIVLSLREDEEKWRVKFLEMEKTNDEMGEKLGELGRDLKVVLDEKKEKDNEIESLMGEKWSINERLSELEKDLEEMKQVKEETLEENDRLEQVKSRQENEIVELQNKVIVLLGNLSSLQESNSEFNEKNKRLLAEIEGQKTSMELVKVERNEVKKTLEEEKMNGVKLQGKVFEISKKMEETAKVIEELRAASDTLVKEKKELENKYNKVVNDKGLTEKKYTDARMKIADLEMTMRSKTDVFESILTMLKDTAGQMTRESNEKKGKDEGMSMKENEDVKLNGEIEPYLAELERIRLAFRNREEKVGEMQQQMESLECSVIEARKKRSWWTVVSSATTILAAVLSFAYATKVR